MSTVKANNYYDASGGSAAQLYGVSMRNGGTAWVNRIINGDMRIDQRNAGASVTPTNYTFIVDRWNAQVTQSSKITCQRNQGSVTPPAGFTNYLGATSSSAYSVISTDQFGLQQRVEGFNIADLGWGTASAQAITISFWVRSSLTGTFGGAIFNSTGARSYPFTYTISASNTWEYKTITIPGDTSGTWLTDNSVGLQLQFSLGAGSSLSGTAGAWAGAYYVSATGATSVVGTNGATFYITGVQLEAGTVASPFERRDYGRELIMCQRYYIDASYANTGSTLGMTSNVTSGNNYHISYSYPVRMRASPTLTWTEWTSSNFPTNATFQSTGVMGTNIYKLANGTGVGYFLGGYTASAEL